MKPISLHWPAAAYRLTALAPALGFAAVLRLSLLLFTYSRTGTTIIMQGDTSSYLDPGMQLFSRGFFANGRAPEIDRTPGYPIFVMLSGMLVNNAVLAIVVQILLSLISIVLVTRVANLSFASLRPGVWAAWMMAIEPISTTYALRMMPETLFTLLLLIVVERLITFLASYKLSAIAIAGVSLAAATYVRPVSYYLGPLLAIGLFVVVSSKRGQKWKAPLLLIVVVVPCLALWQLRNLGGTGYGGFSSVTEKNLYFYQAAGVSAELQHTSLKERQSELGYGTDSSYLIVHPEQIRWDSAQRLRFMRTDAMDVLKHHLGLAISLQMKGVAIVAFTPCSLELMELLRLSPVSGAVPSRILSAGVVNSIFKVIRGQSMVTIAVLVFETYLLSIYALSMIGLSRAVALRGAKPLLIGICFYFLIISGGAQAVGRYRMPVMPELCVFAAAGLAVLSKQQGGTVKAPPVIEPKQVKN